MNEHARPAYACACACACARACACMRICAALTHVHTATTTVVRPALISADEMRPNRPTASFFRPLRSSAVTAALSTDAFCHTCACGALHELIPTMRYAIYVRSASHLHAVHIMTGLITSTHLPVVKVVEQRNHPRPLAWNTWTCGCIGRVHAFADRKGVTAGCGQRRLEGGYRRAAHG